MSKSTVFYAEVILKEKSQLVQSMPVSTNDLANYRAVFNRVKKVLGPTIVQIVPSYVNVADKFMFDTLDIFVLTTFMATIDGQKRRVFLYVSDKNGVRYAFTTLDHRHYRMYCTPENLEDAFKALSKFFVKNLLAPEAARAAPVIPMPVPSHVTVSGYMRNH